MARSPRLFLLGAAALAARLLAPSIAAAQSPPAEDDDVEIPAQPAPSAPAKAPATPAPSAPAATAAAPAATAPVATAPVPSAAVPVRTAAVQSAAVPSPPVSTASSTAAEVAALRRELLETQARLARRIAELEKRTAENIPASASSSGPAPGVKSSSSWLDSLLGAGAYGLSGYVQAQYENHQDSQDQLLQGGALLNQDRFVVRRGRLRFEAAYPYTELLLELDGNTVRGPTFGIRRAEASLVLRQRPWDGKLVSREARDTEPPLAMLSFGLTDIPFGFELPDSARNRVFLERSQASLAFFPGEPDVGVRLSGGLGFFRYALAVMNGEPLDDRAPYTLRDPNAGKDFVARVGADTSPAPALRVSGGVSALYGSGFHAGTAATKGTAQWRDLNENSAIDPGEVTALPGSAATPSANFERWAIGLDAQIRIKSAVGTTFISAEAGAAQNLDRSVFVADPVATGTDVRHLYYHAAVVQDVALWGSGVRALFGFRAEAYDPNADFFDNRLGKLLPSSQTIQTFSPLVGLSLPGRARLVFQYDAVLDALGRDARGVPADLKNDRLTLRLQVEVGGSQVAAGAQQVETAPHEATPHVEATPQGEAATARAAAGGDGERERLPSPQRREQ